MYVVCVTSWVKPEYVHDYIEACEQNAAATRREPGNLRFDLLRCADNPSQFFFYEAYRTEADFHRHHETEHYLKWRDTVESWMEKPRQAVKYSSLSPADEDELW